MAIPTNSPALSFDEAIRQIESLIEERKLAEAHRACLELLRFDPENIQVIRLKNKVENLVKKYNQEAIKEDLEKMTPLWHEKKYAEILENLKKLAAYIDDYPDLKKIIVKTEKAYQEQQTAEKKIQYRKEFEDIQELINQKSFPEAMRRAEKLRLLNFNNNIKKLIEEIRSTWIKDEIEKNRSLIDSEKFEDILLFYRHLQSIAPESSFLQKQILQTKKRYQQHILEEKREFIYAGIEKTRTLYQLKKYEKARLACEEILQLDPSNHQVEKILKQAKKKSDTEIENEVITQMKTSQNQLATQLKRDPSCIKKI